jgi:hypothetical protein
LPAGIGGAGERPHKFSRGRDGLSLGDHSGRTFRPSGRPAGRDGGRPLVARWRTCQCAPPERPRTSRRRPSRPRQPSSRCVASRPRAPPAGRLIGFHGSRRATGLDRRTRRRQGVAVLRPRSFLRAA